MTITINGSADEPLPYQHLTDKQIAAILSVSPSWVRKQRHLRHSGDDHALTLDAVYVGISPRYRAADFYEWLKNLHQ